MSGEVEKCPILHVRPKFDVFTLLLALKLGWALLLNLHKYLADVCYKVVLYFKILPDSLNEATMKQQMTSISDYIIVCLFQNYKNMRNKRTGAKGKRLSKVFFQRPGNSQVLFDISFLCV